MALRINIKITLSVVTELCYVHFNAFQRRSCQLETSRMERRARRPFWQNVYVLRTNILDYVRIQPHTRTRLP
jgi:hypothetical protein